MIEFNRYDKAVIVSGDGDFYCLIKYLKEKDKLETVVVPNKAGYSALIKKAAKGMITFINDLRSKVEYLK